MKAVFLLLSEDQLPFHNYIFITIGADRDFLIGFSRSWLDTEIATDLWLVYVIPHNINLMAVEIRRIG